jgi:predicted Fe-Mo cluster-binding NifX family protein
MLIAISSNDGKSNSQFSSRFGRCASFVIVNTDTNEWETKSNPAASARGGAGTQVVQFLANNQIQAVVSGRYGPNAFSALKAAGIQAFVADKGTPEELLKKFLAKELEQVHAATGSELH